MLTILIHCHSNIFSHPVSTEQPLPNRPTGWPDRGRLQAAERQGPGALSLAWSISKVSIPHLFDAGIHPQFFGKVRPNLMNELLSMDVYEKVEMTDFQGVCSPRGDDDISDAMSFTMPLQSILQSLHWIFSELVLFFLEWNIYSWYSATKSWVEGVVYSYHKANIYGDELDIDNMYNGHVGLSKFESEFRVCDRRVPRSGRPC
jgi:hypothetical protein